MRTNYTKQFIKDIKANAQLKNKVREIIFLIERAGSIRDIPNCSKLRARNNYFKIRIGNFRIGFKLEDDTVLLQRFLNRKDIYKYFPKK